ncbi:MAG: cache domain-containing protein [Candidatus Contendobacter sp.]|nr:cache domain-containing protein [Candidatus Contendobacter sp.]
MQWLKVVLSAVAMLVTTLAWAAFEITPAVQKELDQTIEVVKGWAAEPVIVSAVAAQNQKGPIAGMDNPKWKAIRRSDDLVKGFQNNDAAKLLKQKVDASQGLYSEAFLNASQGEKVAFVDKTSSYLHKGQPKFDAPFTSGKPWQGQAEFDESSQTHQLQVAVPVLADGKPIGVLVVGVNLTKLAGSPK